MAHIPAGRSNYLCAIVKKVIGHSGSFQSAALSSGRLLRTLSQLELHGGRNREPIAPWLDLDMRQSLKQFPQTSCRNSPVAVRIPVNSDQKRREAYAHPTHPADCNNLIDSLSPI